MSLSRDQYVASLSLLDGNISALNEQIATVEAARDHALFQKWVASSFVTLNESADKHIILPVSKAVYAINDAKAYFKLEATGEIEMTITRDNHGKLSTPGVSVHWTIGELEKTLGETKLENGSSTTIKVAGYKASPAYFFPGCEPKPAEVTVAIPNASQFNTSTGHEQQSHAGVQHNDSIGQQHTVQQVISHEQQVIHEQTPSVASA